MAINLRSILAETPAGKREGFTGAIFTTYTLDLGFFEQLIIPKLDESGCSNIMIFADPDGYHSALEMRGTGVWGVGQNYLCVPVERSGRGVQHAKLAFLASPHHGRLLLGSGNLTMHGYGRNLELYSHFEYNHDENSDIQRYPFTIVWEFLWHLADDGRLTSFAKKQLVSIQNSVPWLKEPVELPLDFRVWHNYERPIWDQFMEWRAAKGFLESPAVHLQAISPFYDQDGKALVRVAQDLRTEQVDLHFHKSSTNFDGKEISKVWKEQGSSVLKLHELHARSTQNKGLVRSLHAKAIIGKENGGAWCISGSANLTSPGLLRSWSRGGNLEMVTFQWSADPSAFEYLLSDPNLQISPLSIEDVNATESEPSERTTQSVFPVVIKDAIVRGRLLEGVLSELPNDSPHAGILSFLRLNHRMPIELIGSNFSVQLPETLKEANAIQIMLGGYITPFRWLDHPDALLKHSARSYHGRIRSQLETVDGTEKLFIELMNYLWQRVDRSKISLEELPNQKLHHKKPIEPKNTKEPEETITLEQFIIPESDVANRLSRHIENQLPYDQSLWSLQDLLSIALLRLTVPVESSTTVNELGKKTKPVLQEEELVEVRKLRALERLRTYLLDYCQRFGQRLTDAAFVNNIGAALLFENLVTLGRVLLNFSSTVNEFSQDDLARCIFSIWAPLISPALIGLHGKPTFEMLAGQADLGALWETFGLANYTVAAFATAFGNPPQWQSGVWDDKRVQKFMVVQTILSKIEVFIGEKSFSTMPLELQDVFGFQSIAHLEDVDDKSDPRVVLLQKQFESLKMYRPPLEEKFSEFLELQELQKKGAINSPRAVELQRTILLKGFQKELQQFIENKLPILPVAGNDDYCPRCGGRLTERAVSELRRGMLVLCSGSHDALIYRIPEIPISILIL